MHLYVSLVFRETRLEVKQTMLDLVLKKSQMSKLGLCTVTGGGGEFRGSNQTCLLQKDWRGLLLLSYIYILFRKKKKCLRLKKKMCVCVGGWGGECKTT